MNNEFRKNVTAKEVNEMIEAAISKYTRPPEERILTDAEFCKVMGISQKTAYNWRIAGKVTYTKVDSGLIYYTYANVLELMIRYEVKAVYEKCNLLNKGRS